MLVFKMVQPLVGTASAKSYDTLDGVGVSRVGDAAVIRYRHVGMQSLPYFLKQVCIDIREDLGQGRGRW